MPMTPNNNPNEAMDSDYNETLYYMSALHFHLKTTNTST